MPLWRHQSNEYRTDLFYLLTVHDSSVVNRFVVSSISAGEYEATWACVALFCREICYDKPIYEDRINVGSSELK